MICGAKAKDKADPIRIEKAFPAIISKAKSQRVNRLMRSRAPKIAHPRRVGSTYLLSGLVKCRRCNRALSGQDAKSGQFSYYVCQSIMKRGKDACKTPRLNARRFEEMVVGKIRSNVLTDGNIRALVKVVDEQMDGVAQEQRTKLETIEDELEDVKRKLGRIWHFIETADNVEMTDASDRIRAHRDRQERLEDLAAEARAILSQRRADLDDVETIAAYAQDMREFLKENELTERRAFIETFVKEIVVMSGDALLRYTIPMPDDSRIPGRNAEEMPLDGSVLSTVKIGGPECTVLSLSQKSPRPCLRQNGATTGVTIPERTATYDYQGVDKLTDEERKGILQKIVEEVVIDRNDYVKITLAIPVDYNSPEPGSPAFASKVPSR